MTKGTTQKSCYFETDEWRAVETIAEHEERRPTKIVQQSVRAFWKLYQRNRVEALELARSDFRDGK